jgi:Asp-tRNA(Asn)/Glu-tRNA(Gln) amidotransferase A subunit family amidase
MYGLKPTAGRIPSRGSFPLAPCCGVVGPIASSAYDLAISYYLTAGPDVKEPVSLQQPPVIISSFSKVDSLKGIKLGVFWPYFEDAHPDIVAACKASLEKMKQLGAQVIDIEIPHLLEMRNSHTISITSEFASGTRLFPRHKMSHPTRIALQVFDSINSRDLIAAARMRTKGMNLMRDLFRKVDAIVTPTTGLVAQKIPPGAMSYGLSDYTTTGQVMKYIFLANGLGIPAVTCPVGYDTDGMPIGIQYQAKWWNEDLLLRLAHASEHIHGASTKKPQVYTSLL